MNAEAVTPDPQENVEQSIEAVYKQFGFEKTSLKGFPTFATSIALKIGEEFCQYHRVVPLEENEEGAVKLAMADPLDMVAGQRKVHTRTDDLPTAALRSLVTAGAGRGADHEAIVCG